MFDIEYQTLAGLGYREATPSYFDLIADVQPVTLPVCMSNECTNKEMHRRRRRTGELRKPPSFVRALANKDDTCKVCGHYVVYKTETWVEAHERMQRIQRECRL